MVAYTILFSYIKESKKGGSSHICLVPKERADIRMVLDENNVLTSNELDFLQTSKHAYLHIRNKHALELSCFMI